MSHSDLPEATCVRDFCCFKKPLILSAWATRREGLFSIMPASGDDDDCSPLFLLSLRYLVKYRSSILQQGRWVRGRLLQTFEHLQVAPRPLRRPAHPVCHGLLTEVSYTSGSS